MHFHYPYLGVDTQSDEMLLSFSNRATFVARDRRDHLRAKMKAEDTRKNRRQLRNKSVEIKSQRAGLRCRGSRGVIWSLLSLAGESSRLLPDRKVFLIWPFRLLLGLPPRPATHPCLHPSTEDINNARSKVSFRFKVFLLHLPPHPPPIPRSFPLFLTFFIVPTCPMVREAMNFAQKMTNERP